MKRLTSIIALPVIVLAVSSLFVTPIASATDANANTSTQTQIDKNAARQAKREADILKKYDKNGNGVLDPEELAKKQANEAKMQALRDAKKRKAAERAAAAQPGSQAPAQAPQGQ